jgi:hypothetical protein
MKYLIAILLLASTALAQNNSGTLVIAPIRPQASNDTFPSAIANEIQGGPFSVATTAAMSNIPAARLVPGALAYVTNDRAFRLWSGTNWSADAVRGAIGLDGTNEVLFGSTTVTNGTLYVFKTNTGPFEALANLINSNNTTLSNETLFRVGLAEATNRSAQFGFRVTRTNNGGEGFAVFSVYGYNALMMIGPSDRSRTNTATNAAIEADIWTITPTNRVMTLRDTNTGALTMHQDLGFGAGLTNTAPTNTNTPAAWLRVWIGTNSYRVPLYQ